MTQGNAGPQRPPGYAPKGTSVGFLGLIAATSSPLVAGISLIPVLKGGDLVAVDLFVVSLVVALLLIVPLTLGFRRRRLWYVRFVYVWGIAGLAAFATNLVLWLLVFAKVLPESRPQLRYVLIASGFDLLGNTLFVYWTLRLLRLRYWQPSSRPEQWESPDPATARWADFYGIAAPSKKR